MTDMACGVIAFTALIDLISWYRTIDYLYFFGIADGSPINQLLCQHGFFVVGKKQSQCRSISITPECEKMRVLPFSLLIANGPFGRHGP